MSRCLLGVYPAASDGGMPEGRGQRTSHHRFTTRGSRFTLGSAALSHEAWRRAGERGIVLRATCCMLCDVSWLVYGARNTSMWLIHRIHRDYCTTAQPVTLCDTYAARGSAPSHSAQARALLKLACPQGSDRPTVFAEHVLYCTSHSILGTYRVFCPCSAVRSSMSRDGYSVAAPPRGSSRRLSY
jgi:hypothetical protein